MAYPMSAKPSKAPARPAGSTLGTPAASNKSSEGGSWVKGLITLIVVFVIIAGGIYLVTTYTEFGSGIFSTGPNLSGDFQAVFLTNGQVYFGKIAKIDKNFVTLKEIYYLQVVTNENTISQDPDIQSEPEQRLTLIKLGNEIHGPKDEMMINRDHVILIEDLKDDSRVIQAISDYTTEDEE